MQVRGLLFNDSDVKCLSIYLHVSSRV